MQPKIPHNSSSYLDAEQPRFISDLMAFIRIPSVSGKPENRDDMVSAAQWLAARMKSAGIHSAEVVRTQGHPIVYGEWLDGGSGKPTLLIYGHFDVQPAEPVELWDSPPFEPELRDGKVFGRGASDNKGGLLSINPGG